jgi:hypothetical protein
MICFSRRDVYSRHRLYIFAMNGPVGSESRLASSNYIHEQDGLLKSTKEKI